MILDTSHSNLEFLIEDLVFVKGREDFLTIWGLFFIFKINLLNIKMSVYGGFATRKKESLYNSLLNKLLQLLVQKVLSNVPYNDLTHDITLNHFKH
jgi:hypothetical protein